MGVFALAAAVVALLAILDLAEGAELLWWWLGFIALHFATGWATPVVVVPWRRGRKDA
jgi:hypothetical protein